MKKLFYRLAASLRLCAFALIILFSTSLANAQSTNQSYPTPIITNEISGKIPARDLGDARLTSYFYTFEGTQGDVFINVVTTNFNGDIDIFTAANLKPLTKITIYANETGNETGRAIYLRQPVKLILRVEGRTPNDDAATFRIKFAGSFAPSPVVAENAETETPEVKSDNQSDIRVNSVGTIIEVKPKPTPQPKEIIVKKSEKKTKTIAKAKRTAEDATIDNSEKSEVKPAEKEIEIQTATKKTDEPAENKTEEKNIVVTVTENPEKKDETETTNEAKKETTAETKTNEETSAAKKETSAVKVKKENKKPTLPKPLPPSALENIRLVILFKDGTKIERPMSEILKFSVDRGVLTVISKDGAIGRYSILDIEKTTIE
ncbi:MAG: hypothetical protein ACR2HG_07105 [Pyrinomonadaceae bacterium]